MTRSTDNASAHGRAGAGRWAARLLGHPRTGLILLAVLLLYLAVASLWPPPAGTEPGTPSALYSWVALKILLGLVALSLACATVTRVPLRWANLGVWLAHGGVVLLASGASWYVAGSTSGLAVAFRGPDGQFAPIERFYLSETAAIYAGMGSGAALIETQTPVRGLLSLKAGVMVDLPVRSPLEDVSISASEFLPSADLVGEWREDGPVEVPAVRILVCDGDDEGRMVLCPRYRFAREYRLPNCVVRFLPGHGGEDLDWRAEPNGRAIVVIGQAADGRAALLVMATDGTSREYRADVGEQVTLKLIRGDVRLTVERFMSRAWLAWTARPAGGGDAPAAARVKVTIGGWSGSQWLPMHDYVSAHHGPFAHLALGQLPLPGGRTLWLSFAPQSRRLPTPLRVVRHERLFYPGSDTPRDYVCWLAVGGAGCRPAEWRQCRMNRPVTIGPMRVYQREWLDGTAADERISFMVSFRPGMWAIWAGAVLVCLGLPYNFYLRPLLLRRRKGATP